MPRGVPRITDLLRRRGGWSVPQPTEYGGYRYRSRAEARYARRLDLESRAGTIRAWRRADTYPLVVNGRKCGHYTPDFLVTHLDGKQLLIEVKGWAARDFGLRFKLFRALYPELSISIVDGQGRPWKAPLSAFEQESARGAAAR
jgi:hypothetical protein